MRVVFIGLNRPVWRLAALHVLTLGILRRVWLYRINKEMDGHDALGLRHGVHAAMLWAAAGAVAWLLLVGSLGLPPAAYAVAPLFLVPTAVLQLQTAQRTRRMTARSPVRYGSPTWVWVASLVPLAGSLFFLAWEQGRLNRFWAHERAHPGRGVEVDVELGADPAFLVELDRARRESYFAGSRFDRRSSARRAWLGRRVAAAQSIQAERRAVREAGGSVPVLPLRRPSRPRPVRLAVTCGRCQTRFAIERDPAAETPLVCPKCGQAEVLPALWENPLAGTERAAVATLQARCPKCHARFTAVRNLFGPTALRCPQCGRKDTLAGPRGRAASRA